MAGDGGNFAGALRRLAGDEQLFRDLIQFFFEDYPGLLDQLREGVSKHDGESVERAAHRIRGLVSNFDEERPIEAALRLETSGHSRDFEGARADLNELENGVQHLAEDLTAYCDSTP